MLYHPAIKITKILKFNLTAVLKAEVPLSLSKDPSQVWFMISETYDVYTPYRILLFYDNRRNNRDGEDL